MLKTEAAAQFARLLARDEIDFASDREALAAMREAKRRDSVSFHTDWSFFKDGLHRDGQITDYQAHSWVCPR